MKADRRIQKQRSRRVNRVRNRVRRDSAGKLRLSVFRSNKHIYAQVIDDKSGRTIVSACSTQSDISAPGSYSGNKSAAAKVGKVVAERLLDKGVSEVVFDRGPYKFHGRVAALAEAAREHGLVF